MVGRDDIELPKMFDSVVILLTLFLSIHIFLPPECFIADTVYLGVPAVHMGTIRLAKIVLGDRVFIGNGAVLPLQTLIGHHSLVGVMSAPPLAFPLDDANAVMHWPEPALRAENGTAWLGNPAMFLPNRQKPHGTFGEEVTYRPSFMLRVGRFIFECLKITLPFVIYILTMLLLLGDFYLLRTRFAQAWHFWCVWPLLYMGAGFAICFVTLLMKWLLIGKYISGEFPMWASFIWRHDLVTSMLDSLAHPYFINILRGTPFVSYWFRLLGATVGSRVWMDTTAITEPDLVHIGDDSAIHNDAQLQTHLFEDRIMKLSVSAKGRGANALALFFLISVADFSFYLTCTAVVYAAPAHRSSLLRWHLSCSPLRQCDALWFAPSPSITPDES